MSSHIKRADDYLLLIKKLRKFDSFVGKAHKENRMGWWKFHVRPSTANNRYEENGRISMQIVISTPSRKINISRGEKLMLEFNSLSLHVPVAKVEHVSGTYGGNNEYHITVKGKYRGIRLS